MEGRSQLMTDLVPISDEQAKAIQEALRTLRGVGAFLEKALGGVPEDLVGLLGGDWLRVRRAENMVKMIERAKERLEARGVEEPEPANLTIALPILRAAADESREELRDIWARLLAAAMDPSRANRVRAAFIETAKGMEPLDAALLRQVHQQRGQLRGKVDLKVRQNVMSQLHVVGDEIEVSLQNLIKLGLLEKKGRETVMTVFGGQFLRAISDN
jgi:hypothetical protein